MKSVLNEIEKILHIQLEHLVPFQLISFRYVIDHNKPTVHSGKTYALSIVVVVAIRCK
jgi:hypothetical protein